MTTPAYGLLGYPLGHSYSPEIHRALGNPNYSLIEADEQELDRVLREKKFIGLNVTIPYKKKVMPYCHRLTERAARIGSVNTITLDREGNLVGDNTDYDGFSYMLRQSGMNVHGQKCLVLGSGGASRTVCTVLADRGARVVVISRGGEDNYENLEKHADATYLVNTTPVGMYPKNGESPVDLTRLPHLRGVLDLIYNPSRTALMLQAQSLGIATAGGLSMLVAQAKAAHERFFRTTVSWNAVGRITRKLQKKMRNLVLVGMPGCGKSTLARRVAAMTGREAVDTDRLIEEMSGKAPADLIRSEGVAVLRQWETKALRSVCSLGGRIIATGGGIVTMPENIPLLRENSTVVFLNRPISHLSTFNRPLSSSPEALKKMYEERLPLYRAACDVELWDNRGAKAFFATMPRKLKRLVR